MCNREILIGVVYFHEGWGERVFSVTYYFKSIMQKHDFSGRKYLKTETISSISVLPVRPVLDVAEQYMSSRNVVFQLYNFELIKNLVD